jgi:hypothetical protein
MWQPSRAMHCCMQLVKSSTPSAPYRCSPSKWFSGPQSPAVATTSGDVKLSQ